MPTISRLTPLFSFAIALVGILPLYPWLENLPRAVALIGCCAGVALYLLRRPTLPNWQFHLALLPVFGWYLLQYSRSNPVQPVVSLLVIMLTVRVCGEQTVRNQLQIALLALLCLASRSLYDLSPGFLVWLGLMLILLPLLLVLLTVHAEQESLRLAPAQLVRLALVALLMTLATVPAMTVLFPLLPRTALPLWQFAAAAAVARPGLSDRVEPGTAGQLGSSRAPVFRAELPQQPQPPYWRAIVFNRVEGNRWVRSQRIPSEQLVLPGRLLELTIFAEPGPQRQLAGLDAPLALELPRVTRGPDLVYELARPQLRTFGYTVRSDPSGLIRSAGPADLSPYLTVPETVAPRIRQLAADLHRQGSTTAERLAQVESFFAAGNFRYSRQGLPTGPDALEQFLLETRTGHCEFFAASCALLLRLNGVPCRLVGGYLGGTYNQLGGYYLVTEDQAHVWVEVYQQGQGWLRLDPSRWAINSDAVLTSPREQGVAARIRALADALEYRWNRTVVTYDLEQQLQHARRISEQLQGVEQRLRPGLVQRVLLVLLAIALVVVGLLWGARHLGSRQTRLLQRFERILRQRYGRGLDNRGLLAAAAATRDPVLVLFARQYAALIYQDKPVTADDLRRLHRLLDQVA